MKYQAVVPGIFLSRPNRFIAQVRIGGREETVHVKNTGRCRELLPPGARVYLEHAPSPSRKTAYSLIAVEKGDRLINMDSQAPNRVVEEALLEGWVLPGMKGAATSVRREVKAGESRLDFAVESGAGRMMVEAKGVTLEEHGAVLFPDAPTLRGIKHIRELERVVGQGDSGCVVFVVQMEEATHLSPNDRTQPEFGEALRQAEKNGVKICAFTCTVRPDSLKLKNTLPVLL